MTTTTPTPPAPLLLTTLAVLLMVVAPTTAVATSPSSPPPLSSLSGDWQDVRVCAASWESPREVCAGPGTSEQQCLELGCCWSSSNASLPWCFLPNAPADWDDTAEIGFFGSNQAAPAVASFRGGARAAFTGDVAAVSCTTFAPYAAPCDYDYGALADDIGFPYNLTVNGERPNALPRFRWTAYGVQRMASGTSGVQVKSEARLLHSQPALLVSVSVGSLAVGSTATVSADLGLQFRDFATSVWGWDHPVPASDLAQFNHTLVGGGADGGSPILLSADTQSDARAAASVWSDVEGAVPSLTLVPLGTGTGGRVSWTFVVPSSVPVTFGFLLYVSRNATDAAQMAATLGSSNFNSTFALAAAEWDGAWADAFTPGGAGRYSGSLPVIPAGGNVTEAMSSVYYLSVLSLLQNWKSPPLLPANSSTPPYPILSPYIIPSATPLKSVSTIYLWDTCYAGPVSFSLEPVGMRSVLEQLLLSGIHTHYALDTVSLTGVGPWYSFNDQNVHCLLATYAKYAANANATAFWLAEIAGRRAIDWLDEVATYWQSLPPIPANATAPGVPHLADYGLADNLLECVPTYLHGVPSLNAANIRMMDDAAAIWDLLGTNASRAAYLREESAKLLPLVLGMYQNGSGYWACVYPDGSLHTVQHVIDFFTVAESIGPTALVGTPIADEMVAFLNASLLTPTWMRALSLSDPAAPVSDRSDHGPYGAYAAWPAKTIDGLLALGKVDEAVALFDRVLPTFREGPLGQSNRVYDNPLLPDLMAAKASVDQQFGASASGSFAGTVMRMAGL
jgi:hypothetical protein